MSDKFKPFCAVYLVLINNNEILLARRANTGFQDGMYSLPAGHVEYGESLTQALLREVKEEINIIPENPKFVHVDYRNFLADPDKTYVDVFFSAFAFSGDLINNEPGKCDDLNWFSLENLPDNTIPYIKKVLLGIIRGESFSEVSAT